MSAINEAFTTYDGYVIDHRAEAQVERLTAQNERLRAALQAIADEPRLCTDDDGRTTECERCGEKSDMARAALSASAAPAIADASPSSTKGDEGE